MFPDDGGQAGQPSRFRGHIGRGTGFELREGRSRKAFRDA
jgi:hypothetical protein